MFQVWIVHINPESPTCHVASSLSTLSVMCNITLLLMGTPGAVHPTVCARIGQEESTLAWLCGLGGSQDFHRPADADGFVFDFAYQRLGTRENTAASGRLELCAQRV